MTIQQITDEPSIYKEGFPCWDCNSSDAVTLYLTGKYNLKYPRVKCFSCGLSTSNTDIVDSYILDNEQDEKEINNMNIQQQPKQTSVNHKGEHHALPDRAITKQVAERFDVRSNYDSSGQLLSRSFPFYDSQGNVVATKIKTPSKKMFCSGDIGSSLLFGQQLFGKGSNNYVTITEGEEDAMAVYQMLHNEKYENPVVSIKNGAQSAITNVEQHYEWLNSFDNIIICFDNDDQGQRAAQKVARKFPAKAKIVKMQFKDANEYLKAGAKSKFVNAWFNAETFQIQGVYDFSEKLWNEMTKKDSFTTAFYPWEELNKKTYGMRTGELTIIKAPPKIGKTEFLREVSFHLHKETDFHCGIVFLEEGLKRIAQGFVSKEMNKPIHLPDTYSTEEEMKEAFDNISSKGQLHIFDPSSEISVVNLFSKLEYFVNAKNCRFLFIDHISMFAYKADSQDERRFLDKFCADLKNFATVNDVHITAVIHVNDDGKTRGSRAPVQLCNTLIDIYRDKLNPDPVIANTTKVVVEENRYSGDSGFALDLYYDKETGRMIPVDEDLLVDLLDLDEEEEEKTVQFKEEETNEEKSIY